MTDLAPIAVFAYKRPRHLEQTLAALAANPMAASSHIYIYCDGPKTENDKAGVSAVRRLVSEVKGFAGLHICEHEYNRGLAQSIIQGVNELCSAKGKVIVVEDDLVVSPYFLEYMNGALNHYQEDERIMQISGYMFPVSLPKSGGGVLLPLTTSWGWATWQRAWSKFDPTASGVSYLEADKELRNKFNLDGAYDYFSMLQNQLAGKIDSWAIRWYLTVFLNRGLVLYPEKSLVINNGFDGMGTHGPAHQVLRAALIDNSFVVEDFPRKPCSDEVFELIKKALDLAREPVKYAFWKKIREHIF